MMVLYALLGLTQVLFLPGFLVLHGLGLTFSRFQTAVFSFVISLLVNYLGAFVLIHLSLYTHQTVMLVIAGEVLMLAWLKGREIVHFLRQPVVNLMSLRLGLDVNSSTMFYRCVMLGAALCITYIATIFLSNATSLSVFMATDDVLSWNAWAVLWAKGIFPTLTWNYPQLIPANFSVIYILLGEPIQFFAKAIMPIFMLNMLCMMFYLGTLKKSITYFIAVMITCLVSKNSFLLGMITSGYADFPVAALGFIAVACLLIAQDCIEQHDIKKYLLIGFLCACAAALAKQAGILILLMYPVLAYVLIMQPIQARIKFLCAYVLGVITLVLPVYGYMQYLMSKGLNESEIPWVTHDIYNGVGVFERFLYASKKFLSCTLLPMDMYFICVENKIFYAMGLCLVGVLSAFFLIWALRDRTMRILFGFVFVPLHMFWSMFLCYDMRNYALAIPFFAVCLGGGVQQFLLSRFKRVDACIASVTLRHVIFAGLVVLFVINRQYSASYLIDMNIKKNIEWCLPELNKSLLAYKHEHGFEKKILAEYPVNYVMALNDVTCQSVNYTGLDIDTFVQAVHSQDIGYLLVPGSANKKILKYVDEQVRDNHYQVLFQARDHRLIKI